MNTLLTTDAEAANAIFERNSISTLCLFIPAHSQENEGIPRGEKRGLNHKSSEWREFEAYVRANTCDPKVSKKLLTISDNSPYGGTGGIILTLRESTLKRWLATNDLLTTVREEYLAGQQRPGWMPNKTTGRPRLCVGVLDFLNGAGDFDTFECDWTKVALPTHRPMQVVNNILDSTFWLVGLTKLSDPSCEWSYNPRLE